VPALFFVACLQACKVGQITQGITFAIWPTVSHTYQQAWQSKSLFGQPACTG